MQLSAFRRILTLEVKATIAYADEWPEDNWLDLWHAHVDWKSRGKLSPAHRQAELSAIFRLHTALSDITKRLSQPFHQWVSIAQADPGLDAVYVHTPNPNPKTTFPIRLNGVTWDEPVPRWLRRHIPDGHRVGRSAKPSRKVRWYIESLTGPNQPLQLTRHARGF